MPGPTVRKDQTSLAPTRHVSAASLDTNASGLAESTISYSAFPAPPSSIPTTPIASEFGTPSPSRSTFTLRTAPLIPRRPGAAAAGSSYASTSSAPSPKASHVHSPFSPASSVDSHARNLRHPSSPTSTLSPYDWHDGASSIGVDATEDRLLPTSFITGLLQENAGTRTGKRASTGSDAFSGISEMTYPPASGYPQSVPVHPPMPVMPGHNRFSSPLRNPPIHRPQGGRPPPSAFTSIPESSGFVSDDDTLYEPTQSSIIRTASVSRGLRVPGVSVVGMMPATIHSVSGDSNFQAPFQQDFRDVRSSTADASRVVSTLNDDTVARFKPAHASTPYSPALPSTAGTQTRFLRDSSRTQTPARESMHSAKTTRSLVPSFISRISSSRPVQQILTWRRKPLPPVPLIPHIPIAREMEHRQMDEALPLPDLVERAGALEGLLEKGYHPHHSLNSYYLAAKAEGITSTFDDADTTRDISGSESWPPPRDRKFTRNQVVAPWPEVPTPDSPKVRRHHPLAHKKKRIYVVLLAFIVVAVAAVGATVGVSVKGKGPQFPSCSGNLTGNACNLDATCTCISSVSGQCYNLAQNLVDLIPTVNRLFTVNLTSSVVYNRIWQIQGAPTGNNCARQSMLVDVSPTLDPEASPNRTSWAQSALLWSLVESQDLDVAGKMRHFVTAAPWRSLTLADGPEANDNPGFVSNFAGYDFDFASQTVTPPAVSFVSSGQPTNAQIAQIGKAAASALDRVYSFASASSAQHQKSLQTYWISALEQKEDDLPGFLSALGASPLLIPFDATYTFRTQQVSSLLSNSSTAPFPPPLACYPGLNSSQIAQINAIEGPIFGLSPVTAAAEFESSCYQGRPLYGVLDILRLRLPFIDSRTGVAKQAVVLRRDVVPRAVIYSGEILSALPGLANVTNDPLGQGDARQYGTFSQLNHVILKYLSSISDVNVAKALVRFVLAFNSGSSPDPSTVYQFLASVPPMEVAVFGTIDPSNIGSVVSSLSTKSGSLFFGSEQGAALRQWAIRGVASSVVWAELATSEVVVRDNSFTNTPFNNIWTAASRALEQNALGVGVVNVTTAFNQTGLFSL